MGNEGLNVQAALEMIAAEAARGEMLFSTHAEVALQVRRALEDPDCSSQHLCALISTEPLLSAKVVGLANSVAYNPGGATIRDLPGAIARIGFSALRSVATAFVVRQMQKTPATPEHRALAARLWEHTTHVAALARVIARRVTHQDPEAAFFAGIVHEMGGFYVLSRAAAFPGLLESLAGVWHGAGEARVGRAVLLELGVPASVLEAFSVLWQGYLALPPESLGDTLLLANELAPLASPLADLRPEKTSGMAADIDLQLGEETLNSILADSEEEIASLLAVLRG